MDPTKDTVKVEARHHPLETMRYVLVNKPKTSWQWSTTHSGRRTIGALRLQKRLPANARRPRGPRGEESTGSDPLFTNDGEMAKRLNHPKVALRELYHVNLGQEGHPRRFGKVVGRVRAGPGLQERAEEVSFVKNDPPRNRHGKIHSNRSRIVRRMFEHLGHKVVKVDRVGHGNPSPRKTCPVAHRRHLTERRVEPAEHAPHEPKSRSSFRRASARRASCGCWTTAKGLTFPFDVLVEDDGSPDGTAALVNETQTKHPERIHLLEREGRRSGSAQRTSQGSGGPWHATTNSHLRDGLRFLAQP